MKAAAWTRRGSSGRNLLLSFTGYVVALACGSVASVIAARALGPTGRGELAAMQAVPALVASFASLGFVHSLVYWTARERSEAGRFLASGLATAVPVACAAAVVAAALQLLVLRKYSDDVRLLGCVFAIFVPLNVAMGLPWSTMQGLERFGRWNVARLVPTVLYVTTIGGVAALGVRESTSMLAWYLLTLGVVALPLSFRLVAPLLEPGWFRPDRARTRALIRFGLPSMAATVPNLINQRFDQVLIAAWLPGRELGWYAVAVTWSTLAQPIMWALSSVLLPRIAGEDVDGGRLTFSRGVRTSAVISVAVGALLLLCTGVIPVVFGEDFRGSVDPARVLVLAGVAASMNIVLADGFRGIGRPGIALRAELVGLGVTAVGLAAVVPHGGIMGAAWVSVGSYLLSFAYLLVAYQRVGPGDLRSWGPWAADVLSWPGRRVRSR